MEERTARSILRILAVVTVLVGVAIASGMITMYTAMGDIRPNSRGATRMMIAAVLAYGQVVGWGIALYALSPRLARRITG